jgi:hypothetical protein
MISAARRASILTAFECGDYQRACDELERDLGPELADRIRRLRMPPRTGKLDKKKDARDKDRALFRGIVDYLVKVQRLDRNAAFERACEEMPHLWYHPDPKKRERKRNGLWRVASGGKKALNDAAKTLPNPYVEKLHLDFKTAGERKARRA